LIICEQKIIYEGKVLGYLLRLVVNASRTGCKMVIQSIVGFKLYKLRKTELRSWKEA